MAKSDAMWTVACVVGTEVCVYVCVCMYVCMHVCVCICVASELNGINIHILTLHISNC